jgi:predicted RNA methylase
MDTYSMSNERLIVDVTINLDTRLVVIDLGAGTRRISIGLNADEAQQFSVLLHEASIALLLDNMREYEKQQSEVKH